MGNYILGDVFVKKSHMMHNFLIEWEDSTDLSLNLKMYILYVFFLFIYING